MISETPKWVAVYGHGLIIVCFSLVALGMTLLAGAILYDKAAQAYHKRKNRKD